jgi:hypothetical protein
MRSRRSWLSWVGLVAAVAAASAGAGRAQAWFNFTHPPTEQAQHTRAAVVPIEQMPAAVQKSVRLVLDHPTLFAHGPAEMFPCQPSQYYWFLDHPDRAMRAWVRLGAKCLPITDRGNGRFGWADDQGSDLVWDTVYRSDRLRVWYAEGNVRPAPLLPLVPVRAVVVMRHMDGKDETGGLVMYHQADAFLQTDSKTAALVLRMLGPSVPRMAQEGVSQLQMFFAGVAWYLDRHPDRADWLLLSNAPAVFPEPSRPFPVPPSVGIAASLPTP